MRFYSKSFLVFLFISCSTSKIVEHIEHKDTINRQETKTITEKQEETSLKEKKINYGNVIRGAAYINNPSKYPRKTYYLYGTEHLNLENRYFDIPVVYNKAVRRWIHYFLNRGRDSFIRYASRSGRYAPILGDILESQGLPRDFVFLAMAESGFQNKAKSWAKAVGPWQFMSYTGKEYGLHIDWYVDERRDPIKATQAAADYLKKLMGDFGLLELATAAYNAGEGKLKKAIRRYKTESFWEIRKGRYLKRETRSYVPKIMALAVIGKNLNAFGLVDIDFHDQLAFDTLSVKGGVDLIVLAKEMNTSFEEIQKFNPELLRWFTPPYAESYQLKVPLGMKKVFEECCANKTFKAVAFQKYKVRGKNSRLKDIARSFRIKSPDVLQWINKIGLTKRLAKGQVILLPFREGQSRRDRMYADLYERPRRSLLKKKEYKKRVRKALASGKKIVTPSQYYVVQKGDSLWSIAGKTGQSMDTIIVSNMNIIKHRMIRTGDKLVVR